MVSKLKSKVTSSFRGLDDGIRAGFQDRPKIALWLQIYSSFQSLFSGIAGGHYEDNR